MPFTLGVKTKNGGKNLSHFSKEIKEEKIKRVVKAGVGWFPGGSTGKESACNAGAKGAAGSIPESERSPGGGNGNPLQYSCLENPMDREPGGGRCIKSQIDATEYTCTQRGRKGIEK